MKNGCFPAVIKHERREEYYSAIMKADEGYLDDFCDLIYQEEERSLRMVLGIVREHYVH